jgi:hypothetical protein
MHGKILLISMLSVVAGVAQAPLNTTGGATSTEMATPPPVSGMSYPTQVRSEVRSNYLRGGIVYTTSYIDKFTQDPGDTPIAETTLSFLPTLALDATSARQHATVSYSPGFTLYRPSSELSEMDNLAAVDYSFRLTEHATVTAIERFQDSSSPFIPAEYGTGGPVSGAPISSTPGVTPPFAKRLTNSSIAEITMQTGLNDMIGGGGLFTILHYPSSSATPGLSDSNSRGGMVFYNHRLSGSQYVGAIYQYMDMLTSEAGGESTTKTSTPMGYYTIYPKPQLTLSVSAGPQYYELADPRAAMTSAWGPIVSASIGWLSGHVSFAASYSQSVTGAGGLPGAFHTRIANSTVRWQLAHTWTVGAIGSYAINKSVNALVLPTSSNGHTLSGSASLQHSIGRQVGLVFNYDRVHQSYGNVAAIAANPDSDRFSVSISWTFLRPLGK